MSQAPSTSNRLNIPLKYTSAHSTDAPLPTWMFSIPGVSKIVDRMGTIEFRRRLFHMSPAFIPIGLPFIPHRDVWGPAMLMPMIIMGFVALLLAVNYGHLMRRTGEESWMAAVLGYIVSVFIPLLLLPGQAEIGLMTLQILALGDGSATMGGMLIQGPRLPWNRRKTFSGLASFVVVGTLFATYHYWGESRPAVPVMTAFLICSFASVCAAIVESLPIQSNDNLRVGTTAMLSGLVMSALLT